MNKFNVLVPGAGGAAGINTIKSLRLSNFSGIILATDSDNLAPGFFLSDKHRVLPKANDTSFIKILLNVITKHKISVLFPSSGYDIYPYSDNKKLLSDFGAEAVVSSRDVLEICRDKLMTFKYLNKKFPFTETYTDINNHQFPILAKPRYGKGSKNIFLINNEIDLQYITQKYTDMLYQEYLPGLEYTVDVLSDLDANPLIAVPRIRLKTKAGISTKGKVIRDSYIENMCMDIAKYLGIKGPCCIQLKKSKNNDLKIIEINPRLGGGTIFTTLAGVNFPSMILDIVQGNTPIIPKIKEITILRYFEEIVISS